MDVFSPDTCGRGGVRPLLLVWLFVVEAAADCPKPHGGKNTVLSNAALLMNDFPEGSVAPLECANGYVKESGSGNLICTDGAWTEPDLICTKKDCGPPKPQPNMIFNINDGTLFGAVVEVLCEKGYELSGVSYKQCYVTGWSGRSRCEVVTCDTPLEVTNGNSSWDPSHYPRYGDVVRYTCDEGYVLIGKDAIVCSETGDYDSPPPECKSGRGILMAEDRATSAVTTAGATSTMSSSFRDRHGVTVATTEHIGYKPVIISVVCVSLVACIFVFFLYKFLLRRKGSYDTREDLKPELLQFQNL